MWQGGATTADAHYRFDPSADWQPITNLRRLLDPPGTPVSPNSRIPKNDSLALSIVSLVLAFVPFVCIGGVVCAHVALKRARSNNDNAACVLSIVALVIGYLFIFHTVLIVFFGSAVLFQSPSEPPNFTPNR